MSTPTVRDARRGALVTFLLPTAVALLCVLTRLGHRQPWFDEYATWWASSLPSAAFHRLTEHVDIVFVPYYSFMHAWTWLAGTSTTALRLPGALAMAAAAGLVGLIGRRLFSARAGTVAGLLFALLPTVSRYGQEARPYAFAMFFSLLATLLLLRAVGRPSLKIWAAYTVTVALTGFSHLVALSVLLAHGVIVLRARRSGNHVAHWAFAAAAVGGTSVVLPMVYRSTAQSSQIGWNDVSRRDLLWYASDLLGNWPVATVVLALALLGLWAAGRSTAGALATWALVPPVLTAATGEWLHLFLPRYLLFTLPAWVLLAAAGLVRVADLVTAAGRGTPWARFRTGALVAAAVAGFVLLSLPNLRSVREDLPYEPDYAGAARIVKAGQRPGDGIVYHHTLNARIAMTYQLREGARPADVLMKRAPQLTGWFAAHEYDTPDQYLAGTDRVWFVSPGDEDPYAYMVEAKERALKDGYTVARTERLRHVTVQLLQRRTH
ncbi:glycosyltransferase family 39 protein [Streptomyces sp. NPDC004327]|uniref:glycosyltransferase family 39 protein n=1 Tax=Streptomyces sp. NPDC004327 TaxID=3364699 RepID=UPI0036AAEA92